MPDPDTLPAPVRDALARGQKLLAIKLLREHEGIGLKEAKEAVDAAASGWHAPPAPATPGARRSGLSPGEVPRRGGVTAVLVGLVAAGVALAWVLLNA